MARVIVSGHLVYLWVVSTAPAAVASAIPTREYLNDKK